MDIFVDDLDRLEFGRLLGETARRFSVEIHAYCLMGNHFHLLLRSRGGDLSEAMRWLQSTFATFVNRRHERTGHLFGDRFTSRMLTTDRYIHNVWRYVHRNPIDVVGVDRLLDYRWSSLRTYLGLRPAPDWLRLATLGGWFDGAAAMAAAVLERPVGSRIRADLPAGEVVAAADFVLDERSELRLGRRRTERRALLLEIAWSTGGQLAADLHDHLGLESAERLSTAKWRAKQHRAENHRLDDHWRRVADLVATRSQHAVAC